MFFTKYYLSIPDLEPSSSSTSQVGNKRRGSVAADFAAHRLIVSERQQMAVLKQLTAGEESNGTFRIFNRFLIIYFSIIQFSWITIALIYTTTSTSIENTSTQ